ncbi:termination of G-protein coupled receptor signaling pathway [Stemphylium lycopersici]|nr:hypothetical protein TW65_03428 [Stemphylium lycopersici]RAR00906.1 termination of G-protein coupled receptor signaling pathway [Stemphylium lycopersici]
MGPQVVTDGLGLAYITIFIVWNVLTVASLVFLWLNRQHPSLRIRRLPLLFAGIISLHIYGSICCLAYPIGPVVNCSVEFWMMSIMVPVGMALFHASNSQFLHIASRQKQFARMSSLKDHAPIDEKTAQDVANSRWKRITKGLERADKIKRTLIFIGIGMVIQFALVVFVFFASKKFHYSYGIINYTVKGTGQEVRFKCSKGWEWWLSLVWQFFWSWIYAPYILFKSRGIRDVHGWRLQTICCCLVGLPASPLWLAGLYIPQFVTLNAVFPPPIWFAICFGLMEVFTIGFTIVDVLRANRLRQETLDAIADWEARQAAGGLDVPANGEPLKSPAFSMASTLESPSDVSFSKQSLESNKSDILTMTALENALRTNAMPLLQFAALKDFSGENVSFLTHVADWRRYWFLPKPSTADHRRQQFVAATRIYAHFISLEFSEFPINISSKEMKRLHMVFEGAATILCGRRRSSDTSSSSDNATPFDSILPDDASDSPINKESAQTSIKEIKGFKGAISLDNLGRANLRAVSRIDSARIDDSLADYEIPAAFNEMMFDAAETEIKYLVLTNTWPKFVQVGRANSQMSKEDEEKGNVWMNKFLCS